MQNNNPQTQEQTLSAQDLLVREDYKRIIENLLFITDRPLSLTKLSQVADINNIELTRDIVAALQQEYAQTARAIQILEIGGGFQMATKPEYGRWIRKLFNEKMTAKLSPAALETLAIIAYKQPVTRAEIEAIRGVDIVAPLEKIMERGLVRIVGKKDAPGKPMVYGTTEEFLRLFGLNKISELPELKTFSAKGPREVQSDLPFSDNLPDIRENILPLTAEEAVRHNHIVRQTEEDIFISSVASDDMSLNENANTDAVAADSDADAAVTAQTDEQTGKQTDEQTEKAEN
ncbi:MAG: SMC-Scp complex subunit ScpB [Elusimicrobiota bacterium]|jgi:segregation and condensation protein B|nr:SMC-Scp complex subunit ScpB [Elusimicrobiota bacterium]